MYEVLGTLSKPQYEVLTAVMTENSLSISKSSMSKSGSGISYVWQAYGKPVDHQAAMLALMAQEDVKEFRIV